MGTDKVAFEEDPEDLTIAHAWPEVTWLFPVLFPPYVFPYFFPVFSPPPPVFFPLLFFLSSSTKCLLGCSLRRPRPIAIGNYPPLLFSYIRCSLRRPRPITIGNYPLLFSYIRCSLRRPRPITIGNYLPFIFIYYSVYIYIYIYMLCSTPRVSTSYNLLRTSPYHYTFDHPIEGHSAFIQACDWL